MFEPGSASVRVLKCLVTQPAILPITLRMTTSPLSGTHCLLWAVAACSRELRSKCGSLEKLMALPDETLVYCAHEYTQANAALPLPWSLITKPYRRELRRLQSFVPKAFRRFPPASA